MSDRIVECVPNFSEGRNQDVIDAISNAGRGIPIARVLGIEPDADYNRTVLTIAGEPNAVSEAAFRVIEAALKHIDMTSHEGEHPRIGAVDVCPFVPLKNVTMDDCVGLSKELAIRVSNELEIPTFLYAQQHLPREKPTFRPERVNTRVSKSVYNGPNLPDFGPGNGQMLYRNLVRLVLVRNILVAYNVNVMKRMQKRKDCWLISSNHR